MIDYEPQAWLRIVLTLRGSVAPRLLGRITLAVVFGFAAWWAHLSTAFVIPALVHTLIGAALGLLLVFRTNASYGRYVEARELIGRVVNAGRDLSRQAVTYIADHPERQAVLDDLRRWIPLFYRLLVQNVRDQRELTDLGELLHEDERRRLEPLQHRAPAVATWIGARLQAVHRAGHLDERPLQSMDANLTTMMVGLGGCERVRRTPIPFAYAQHIKVFVVLFCYSVPFAIVEPLGIYTPIASAVLSFALFGIDEIGVEIEDPFGDDPNDLPMERLGDGLAAATREIMAA